MPAAAVLPEVVVGLFVLLFLWATIPVWYPALQQITAGLPGVVQAILTPALNAVVSWLGSFHSWFDNKLVPMALTLWQVWWAYYSPIAQGISAVEAIYNSLHRTIFGSIPQAYNNAVAVSEQLYNSAISYLLNVRTELLGDIAAAQQNAISTAQALYNQAIAYLLNVRDQLLQTISAGDGAVLAQAEQLYNQGIDYTNQQVGSLQNLLNIDLGNVSAQLQALFGQAESDIQSGIAGAEAQAQAGISSLQNELQGELGQASAAAAAATAVVAQAVQEIESSRCMKVCDPLGALGEALQLLDVGALLGFLGYAAADPAGAEGFLLDTITPGIEAVIGDAEALIGLGGKG